MRRWFIALAMLSAVSPQAAVSQVWDWKSLPDPRGEFVRLCAPHFVGRANHPESVCLCLHDYALATVSDGDMRSALMRGISETGAPTIQSTWVPIAKRAQVNATFDIIARPTVQCVLAPP